MPVAVFGNVEQLRLWCKDTVSTGRYRVLSTDESEVILEPTKTSRPLKFGYLQSQDAERLAESIAKEFSIMHIHLKAYRWDDERGPFVKVFAEE